MRLAGNYISKYTFKAITSRGDTTDFKYTCPEYSIFLQTPVLLSIHHWYSVKWNMANSSNGTK
ncbi:hypothetical protein AAEO56_01125 [Flavobacterium sp. DGU11]|uniref:Uncharacterized protein n=1 Tax=Flavobacterium arundinis TaxID=3139143 RepID=A0ABU9HSF1_9FLAO